MAGSLAETVARVLVARAEARRRLTRSDGRLAPEAIAGFCALPTIQWGVPDSSEVSKTGLLANMAAHGWAAANAAPFIRTVSHLWSAPLAELPAVLTEIWSGGLPGAGASLPTLILHLRAPDRFAVWFRAAHLGAAPGPWPEQPSWEAYAAYNLAVSRLDAEFAVCPEEADTFLACVTAEQERRGPGAAGIAAALRLEWEAEAAELEAAFAPDDLADARRRVLRAMALRQGPRSFREQLMAAYGGRCAVTGCVVPEVLEAAHIIPYRGQETDHVQNGLLLRADIHTLFDLGAIAVDPVTLSVLVSHHLHGSDYGALAGRPLRLPAGPGLQPSRELLAIHRRTAGI